MHKLFFYAVLFCFLFRAQPAGSQSFSARSIDPPSDSLVNPRPFLLDLPAIYRYLAPFGEEERAELHLEIGGRPWRLEVWRSGLLHPDYELLAAGRKKNKAFPAEETLFLMGRVAGRDEIEVALALNEGFLLGQIGDLMIEPAFLHHKRALPSGALVSYFLSETDSPPEVFCGSGNETKMEVEELVEESLNQAKDQRADECHTVEVALAADYLAFLQFGDLYLLQNYYLGILNMVRLTFDDEFSRELRIIARGFYVVDCPGCDPWTNSRETRDLLAGFRDWGNAGGFGFYYDLASIWTGRVLNDSLAGLGYLGVVCETRRYNALRNYTQKAGLLRTLQAHEFGHNFSAGHDAEEAPYIMAPAIADVDVWSPSSINTMERYIDLLLAQKEWCLGACVPPEADFAPPQAVGCAPAQVQFVDGSRGEITAWQWSFEGGSANSDTLPNPLVWYPQAGVFGARLRVSNASGESAHEEETAVVVKGVPRAALTLAIDTVRRAVLFQFAGEQAQTYAWQFGDGATSREPNPSHVYAAYGEYRVRLIAGNECGADTSFRTVAFAAPLQAAFQPLQSSGCAPLSVQFSDMSVGEVTTRQWSFPGGAPEQSSLANPLVRYEQPGVYGVRLLVGNGQVESEHLVESAVSATGPPEVAFTAEIDPARRLVQFQFTGENAQTYAWQFGDGAGSQAENPTHTYAGAGEFEVQLTASNDCGARALRQTIVIPTRPAAGFSADVLQACAPFVTTFTDQSQGLVAGRKWSFPGGEPETSAEPSPAVRYALPGWYSVRLEVANAAGADTLIQEAYIRVLPAPEARFEVAGELGDTVFTFINDSFDALDYEWDFGDGEQSDDLLPRHYYQSDGTYRVQLIALNECGRDTAEHVVQVMRPPAADFGIASQSGCSSKVIRFEDRSRGVVAERNWTFEGGLPLTSGAASPVVTYSRPGYYSVKLKVKNAVGEGEVEKTDFVYVPETPSARFSFDYTPGDSVVQFHNLSERAATYLWDFGDGRQSTEANPSHTYRQDGDYTVRLEARNECRSSLMVAQITVVTLPGADFRSDITAGCAPLSVQFENASSENAQNLVWAFPGGEPEVAYGQNPLVTYAQPGRYDVRLTAGNLAGETIAERRQWIWVEEPPLAAFEFEPQGPNVLFINSSAHANHYSWEFGDGQGSEDPSPAHTYQTAGPHEVRLIAINNCGADTTTQALTVIINGTKTPTWQATAKVFPNPNAGQFALQLNVLPAPGARLRLWNGLGQLVREISWNNALSNLQWIQIPEARPGLYLLELESAGQRGFWRVLTIEGN